MTLLSATLDHDLRREFRLTSADIESVISDALAFRTPGAFAQVFLQKKRSEQFTWQNGLLLSAASSSVKGCHVRVVNGDQTGFASSDEANLTNLRGCAKKARKSLQFAEPAVAPKGMVTDIRHDLYPVTRATISLNDTERSERIAMCAAIEKAARDYDPRIVNVTVSIFALDEYVVAANSLDNLVFDKRPMIGFNVSCVAEEDGRREQSYKASATRAGHAFIQLEKARECAVASAKIAVTLLSAQRIKPGVMDVVFSNGWSGVVVHEAIGHGLEGDFNRKGTSAFSGRIGQQVASPLVTIIDDGSMFGERGSLNYDDEGQPTKKTVLIENGILKGYIHDMVSANAMGVKPTGNGRVEDYSSQQMPRMTNTYMAGGESTPEEIIAEVKYGLYVSDMGGGQVDITSGDFVYDVTLGYLIENGKLTTPIKGAALIGNGPEALKHVVRVGNDPSLDSGTAVCGKAGQSVPVRCGMPTIRINNVTVGGAE
jgi:TldD protein